MAVTHGSILGVRLLRFGLLGLLVNRDVFIEWPFLLPTTIVPLPRAWGLTLMKRFRYFTRVQTTFTLE